MIAADCQVQAFASGEGSLTNFLLAARIMLGTVAAPGCGLRTRGHLGLRKIRGEERTWRIVASGRGAQMRIEALGIVPQTYFGAGRFICSVLCDDDDHKH